MAVDTEWEVEPAPVAAAPPLPVGTAAE
ncbi:hypothetical protein SMF913_25951 [Streptomyces malaysiensis]|uniref:Uncharacterized protein n=1 Tax=Streptomyces malaysiensis TaxID=92644 RepID=A0A2J7YR27_STRMQ|nr:hypothetical protein SMF913_25951 [Streptomyces malaysiensis]